MRRADRLFRLVGLLQRRRTTTAASLAERLEVSERTVYRDVADLIGSGVPIEGAAGVGYRLDRGFDLPPLMFNEAEIEAVVLGARIVQAFADPALVVAAEEVLGKVRRVLPDRLAASLDETRLYGHRFRSSSDVGAVMATLRMALRQSRKVELHYRDGKSAETTRIVRPLALSFLGNTWLLTAWCETRQSFRNFRLDRLLAARATAHTFTDEPGKRFEDFLALVRDEGDVPLPR